MMIWVVLGWLFCGILVLFHYAKSIYDSDIKLMRQEIGNDLFRSLFFMIGVIVFWPYWAKSIF